MGFWGCLNSLWEKTKEAAVDILIGVIDVTLDACLWTYEMLHAVKEVTADIIESVSDVISSWGHMLADFMRTKTPKTEIYEPEPVEMELLEESKKIINNHCPDGIQDSFEYQGLEQRVQTFEEMAVDVAHCFGLRDIPEVKFFTPSDLNQNTICGYYNRQDNTLNLNVSMIVSDCMDLVEEQVYTIFHEMIHARQWEAVMEIADGAETSSYGYSNEKLMDYASNFIDYISPDENPEAYEKQPLERDAFGFERHLRNNMQ